MQQLKLGIVGSQAMVIREKLSRGTHLYTCGFNAIRVFKLSAFLLQSSIILTCFVNPSERLLLITLKVCFHDKHY